MTWLVVLREVFHVRVSCHTSKAQVKEASPAAQATTFEQFGARILRELVVRLSLLAYSYITRTRTVHRHW